MSRSLKIDCSGPVDVIPDSDSPERLYRSRHVPKKNDKNKEKGELREIKMEEILKSVNCKDFY